MTYLYTNDNASAYSWTMKKVDSLELKLFCNSFKSWIYEGDKVGELTSAINCLTEAPDLDHRLAETCTQKEVIQHTRSATANKIHVIYVEVVNCKGDPWQA